MANSTKPSEGTPPSYCTDLPGTTAQIKDGKRYFCLARHFFANSSVGLRSILMKGINRSGVYN